MASMFGADGNCLETIPQVDQSYVHKAELMKLFEGIVACANMVTRHCDWGFQSAGFVQLMIMSDWALFPINCN